MKNKKLNIFCNIGCGDVKEQKKFYYVLNKREFLHTST